MLEDTPKLNILKDKKFSIEIDQVKEIHHLNSFSTYIAKSPPNIYLVDELGTRFAEVTRLYRDENNDFIADLKLDNVKLSGKNTIMDLFKCDLNHK